jgi:hypothetical protein
MDQHVRASHHQATTAPMNDESPQGTNIGKPAFGSAMVIVLGLVALVSMAFGFVLGLMV